MKTHTGQTLVMLVVFVAMALVLSAAAIMAMIVNNQAASSFELSNTAYDVAEAGAENALLRLLRDPEYSGENVEVGDGEATVTVSDAGGVYTINSVGRVHNFVRELEVSVSYSDNILVVNSWTERWD